MIRKELVDIVGSDYVLDDDATLTNFSKDYSFTPHRKPDYVVLPENLQEIQQIVTYANTIKIPIIPRSSDVGFYGSGVPTQGGIIVKLTRMNKILNIDTRNKAARMQPGVRFGQLQEELKKHNLRALNPLLPHLEKSVITNYLETIPALIPKFEYSDPILTMEMVMPEGNLFRTGGAAGSWAPEESETDLVFPHGPAYVGINKFFQGAQGTFGIVTWMNVKVEPLPSMQKLFLIPFQKLEDLIDPIYKIQRRMIGYECFILNNLDIASIIAKKPGDIETIKGQLPPWVMSICLGGLELFPEERIEYEEEVLMEIASDFKFTVQSSFSDFPGIEKDILKMLGEPWKEDPYWKFRYKGRSCDLIFLTTFDKVPEFTNAVFNLSENNGYPINDIGVYLQPMEYGRVCHVEYSFHYDPNSQKDVENIRNLYLKAGELIVSMGGLIKPYGPLSDIIYQKATTYTPVQRRVKEVFDPNKIMNPNRIG